MSFGGTEVLASVQILPRIVAGAAVGSAAVVIMEGKDRYTASSQRPPQALCWGSSDATTAVGACQLQQGADLASLCDRRWNKAEEGAAWGIDYHFSICF